MKKIMITAHNGCEGMPDHTLATIEKGIAVGADCVEIDVRADSEGRLWLIHDRPESFAGLVSLEEAFAPIRESGIAVNCDLKEKGLLLPTIELADKMGIGADQLIFSGVVEPDLLEANPDIARRSRIFLNSEVLVADLTKTEDLSGEQQTEFLINHSHEAAERFHALGAEALNTYYNNMPDELIAKMREENVRLSLWTLNSEEVLMKFMAKDVYNFTTRIPVAAMRIWGACLRQIKHSPFSGEIQAEEGDIFAHSHGKAAAI